MNNFELKELIQQIRDLILQYRTIETQNISSHISSVEIAVNLTEMYLYEQRNILKCERIWFEACYHLMYVFDSDSKWFDISNLYCNLSDEMNDRKFK